MIPKKEESVLERRETFSHELQPIVVQTKQQKRAELIVGLLKDYYFRTLLSGELYVYDYKSGIWRSGGLPQSIIKTRVQRTLGHANATNQEKSIIVSSIKDSTSIYPEYNDDIEFWNVPSNLICVQNGILDILSRKLIPHNPNYHFLQRIPVAYKEDAREKGEGLIRKFLYEVADKGDDVLGHYEMVGYCLYRAYPFQTGFLFIGSGDNGKSTFNNVVNTFLGKNNVSNISLQGLCSNRFSSSNLIGKLANIYNDITAKELKDTGRFKMLTGGDSIDAEKKNIQKRFKFVNYAKLIFSCNEVPKASSDDTRAFWKRWIPVHFNNVFEKGNRDENLTMKLVRPEELSTLLLDALDGLKRLFDNKGFSHGKNVEETRMELLLVSDPIKFFAEEKLKEHSESHEVKNVVYIQYKKLCRKYNLPIKALNAFTRGLKLCLNIETCQRKVEGKMTNCYCGVRFKDKKLRLLKQKKGELDKHLDKNGFGCPICGGDLSNNPQVVEPYLICSKCYEDCISKGYSEQDILEAIKLAGEMRSKKVADTVPDLTKNLLKETTEADNVILRVPRDPRREDIKQFLRKVMQRKKEEE